MCCSMWPANFTKTITGTWEVLVDGRLNHVLWYQNNVGEGIKSIGVKDHVFELVVVQALAGVPWREVCAPELNTHQIAPFTVEEELSHRISGGRARSLTEIYNQYTFPELKEGEANCLIIPLQGAFESIRVLNTIELPNLLEDIGDALVEPTFANGQMVPALHFGTSGGEQMVYVQMGIYDIVIAQNASMLTSALQEVEPLKRPKLNDALFGTLERWYQCPVAVCCFNNAESGKARPLAFAFQPFDPEHIVVYTLDAHDGQVPNPSALVKMDHAIFVGSYLTPESKCAKVTYRDQIPDHMSPYILDHVMGMELRDRLQNGDISFSTEAVRAGIFDGSRDLPPFGPNHMSRMGHRVRRSVEYAYTGA